jgi:ABC-type bacteriocin/lantibiotic exporter with double-glycine peptidase domain
MKKILTNLFLILIILPGLIPAIITKIIWDRLMDKTDLKSLIVFGLYWSCFIY